MRSSVRLLLLLVCLSLAGVADAQPPLQRSWTVTAAEYEEWPVGSFVVPTGKRLCLEHISLRTGPNTISSVIRIQTTAGGVTASHWPNEQRLRLWADPGTTVSVFLYYRGTVTVTVSGFLEPAK